MWIAAQDELPAKRGSYFIIDLRYNIKGISHYTPNRGSCSLFNRSPQTVIWWKESTEQVNERIKLECEQGARAKGGVYIWGKLGSK